MCCQISSEAKTVRSAGGNCVKSLSADSPKVLIFIAYSRRRRPWSVRLTLPFSLLKSFTPACFSSSEIFWLTAGWVIPNAVAILAVIVLMFLVFLYTNASTGSDTHPIKSKVAKNLFITLLVIVVTLVGSLIWTAVSYTQDCEPDHTHYIICSDEYTIVSRKMPNSNSEELYLQFIFEGKSYCFDFNERYIHNGNLYYCQEHNTLE